MSDLAEFGKVDDLLEMARDVADEISIDLSDVITETQGKLRQILVERLENGEI